MGAPLIFRKVPHPDAELLLEKFDRMSIDAEDGRNLTQAEAEEINLPKVPVMRRLTPAEQDELDER